MLDETQEQSEMAKRRDSTNIELCGIVEREQLTRPQVAEITGMTKACVDQWLRPAESKNYRTMHERYMRLLKWELGLMSPKDAWFHRRT
jgi:DNA-binding transcriptional regulator YiaG